MNAKNRHGKCRQQGSRRNGHRVVILLGLCVGFVVGMTMPASTNASERRYGLRSEGHGMSDLLVEASAYIPLARPNVVRKAKYEYMVVLGNIVREDLRRSEADGTGDNKFYPVWGELTVTVERMELVNSDERVREEVSVVARHVWYVNGEGEPRMVRYGSGSERHNRTAVGDRVLLVAVRPTERGSNGLIYGPEFLPYFSLTFSAIVTDDEGRSVCVVEEASADTDPVGKQAMSWSLLPMKDLGRTLHCYAVSESEAFESIVELVRRDALK